jgi:chromosome segregation ATPase
MTDDITIVERGAVFSRARHEPRKARLAEIREQLFAPCESQNSRDYTLFEKLRTRASMILLQLESLALQQDIHERNVKSIEEQLARAQGRWSDLPDVTLGLSPGIDKVRQHILSEKQSLMQELRQSGAMHEDRKQRSIASLSELYSEYASAARTLAFALGQDLPVPSLNDLLDFIPLAPMGDEVIVLSTPSCYQQPPWGLP